MRTLVGRVRPSLALNLFKQRLFSFYCHFSVIPCSSGILIFKFDSFSEGCEGRVRPSLALNLFKQRLFSFYCHFSVIPCSSGILILKLNLIGKAVKAESCQAVKAELEKEKFALGGEEDVLGNGTLSPRFCSVVS